VVDHLLYLLVEEGIPRLEGGTRLVGRAASHLQGALLLAAWPLEEGGGKAFLEHLVGTAGGLRGTQA